MEQQDRISLVVLEAFWVQLFRFDWIGLFLLLSFDPGLHRQNLKDLQLFVVVLLTPKVLHLHLNLPEQIMRCHHFRRIKLPLLFLASLLSFFLLIFCFLFFLLLVLDSISLHALQVFVLFFLIYVEF